MRVNRTPAAERSAGVSQRIDLWGIWRALAIKDSEKPAWRNMSSEIFCLAGAAKSSNGPGASFLGRPAWSPRRALEVSSR